MFSKRSAEIDAAEEAEGFASPRARGVAARSHPGGQDRRPTRGAPGPLARRTRRRRLARPQARPAVEDRATNASRAARPHAHRTRTNPHSSGDCSARTGSSRAQGLHSGRGDPRRCPRPLRTPPPNSTGPSTPSSPTPRPSRSSDSPAPGAEPGPPRRLWPPKPRLSPSPSASSPTPTAPPSPPPWYIAAIRQKEARLGQRLTTHASGLPSVASATSGRGLDLVVGVAGSGKTTALDVLRAAYEADGYRVLGTAISGQAARALHDEAGVARPAPSPPLSGGSNTSTHLDERTVLIIDEAGMADDRPCSSSSPPSTVAGAKAIVDRRPSPARRRRTRRRTRSSCQSPWACRPRPRREHPPTRTG